jgi:hypothetical protein
VILAQGGQHIRIVGGVENAIDDCVQVVVESITGYEVNEADIGAVRAVALFKYSAPKVVLAHYRDAAPEPGADFCRDGAFARGGITAKYY